MNTINKIGIIAPPMSGHLNPILDITKYLEKISKAEIEVFSRSEIQEMLPPSYTVHDIGDGRGPIEPGNLVEILYEIAQISGRKEQEGLKLINLLQANHQYSLFLIDFFYSDFGLICNHFKIPYVIVTPTIPRNPRDPWLDLVFHELHYQYPNIVIQSKAVAVALLKKLIVDYIQSPNEKINQRLKIYQKAKYFETSMFRGEWFPYPIEMLDFAPSIDYKHEYLGLPVLESNHLPVPQLPNNYVYISMGTTPINNNFELLQKIVVGIGELNENIVISTGNYITSSEINRLKELTPYVYKHVDQRQVLTQAKLFVTHCGFNSIVDAIISETPMIGIPQVADQFDNSKLLEHHDIGLILYSDTATSSDYTTAAQRIITQPNFKVNCYNLKWRLESSSFSKSIPRLINTII